MGSHLTVLSESFSMNTNMTGLRWFSKQICVLVVWKKVAFSIGRVKTQPDMCFFQHQPVSGLRRNNRETAHCIWPEREYLRCGFLRLYQGGMAGGGRHGDFLLLSQPEGTHYHCGGLKPELESSP